MTTSKLSAPEARGVNFGIPSPLRSSCTGPSSPGHPGFRLSSGEYTQALGCVLELQFHQWKTLLSTFTVRAASRRLLVEVDGLLYVHLDGLRDYARREKFLDERP